MRRRTFLGGLAGAARGWGEAERLPAVRAITRGPKFHWFGYYDKLEFDPSSRYVLGMEAGFENRTPEPEDVIRVGVVNLGRDDEWTGLGESRAWCWQQGCMLQWLPGSQSEVIWNDREGDHFVSHILDIKSRKRRTLPGPIYALSPDGNWSLAPDFRRLHDMRPGYGYAGIPDPNAGVRMPEDAGIWRMNLKTGKQELIVPFAAMRKFPYRQGDWKDAKHWFNHLLFSPDGTRFSFLHRWSVPGASFTTRMFTAKPDGTDLYELDPNGRTSHYIWRDPQHILAWAYHPSHGERFYVFEDRTERVEVIGPAVMPVNGHCTYLPGNRWILNDTYPDKEGDQNPYLYHVASGQRFPLGHFRVPVKQYRGEWRCDTHPRFSPDGKKVVIDSVHGGNGRQLYLIDVSGIVGER